MHKMFGKTGKETQANEKFKAYLRKIHKQDEYDRLKESEQNGFISDILRQYVREGIEKKVKDMRGSIKKYYVK